MVSREDSLVSRGLACLEFASSKLPASIAGIPSYSLALLLKQISHMSPSAATRLLARCEPRNVLTSDEEETAGAMIHQTLQDAVGQGLLGFGEDFLTVLGRGLQLNLSDIGVPVLLFFGKSDDLVPLGTSAWLASRCSRPRLRLCSGGHGILFHQFISLLSELRDILKEGE